VVQEGKTGLFLLFSPELEKRKKKKREIERSRVETLEGKLYPFLLLDRRQREENRRRQPLFSPGLSPRRERENTR